MYSTERAPGQLLMNFWMPWTVWRKPANLSIRFWKTGMIIMTKSRMEETAEVHPAETAGEAEAMAVQEAVREEAKVARKEAVAVPGLPAQAGQSQLRRLMLRKPVRVMW